MDILQDLSLVARWAAHGTVHLVGAVALDLVVEPDIANHYLTAQKTRA